MIHELSIKQFNDIVVDKLADKYGTDNVLLKNPQNTATFPCCIVSLPLDKILITEGGIPVRKLFSISVEWWDNKKSDAMQLLSDTDILLRSLGLTRGNANVDGYDDITKKYRYGGQYEVSYNGLTNSFERIK